MKKIFGFFNIKKIYIKSLLKKKNVFIYKSYWRLIYKFFDGMIILLEKLDRRKNGMWVKGFGF